MRCTLPMPAISLLSALLLLMIFTSLATAAPTFRANRGFFNVRAETSQSTEINFKGGSEIKIDNNNGWGFGFGYHVNTNLELSANFSWQSTNYTLDSYDDNNDPIQLKSKMDIGTSDFNLTYNFLDGNITPFVTGGLGWTYLDSNIISGPPSGVCYWYPYYGYACGNYVPTYSENYFSYNAGLGLRWEITEHFFMKGTASSTWINVSKASNTPHLTRGQLDIGYTF